MIKKGDRDEKEVHIIVTKIKIMGNVDGRKRVKQNDKGIGSCQTIKENCTYEERCVVGDALIFSLL